MTSLLIVEDDAAIRESLVDYLTDRGYHVAAAGTLRGAERELESRRFAAVLLDLKLPDGDGLELLRGMRRAADPTPVLVLTARGEEEHRIVGLQLGADDYLVKPFSVRELEARIEAVLRRAGTPVSSLRIGSAEVDLAGHEVVRDGRRERLVAKEAELLAFLVKHAGVTFRRDELLREVWGHDALPTTRTVDTHVFNLRRKIEEKPDAPQHLITVHGVGYRLVLEPTA